jgi:tetratricopeptide (TPR) repeat protein
MQAAFRPDQVEITGRYNDYTRVSDEADRRPHVFHFCPDCGSSVFYTEDDHPEWIVVSVGSFADPSFPPPTESGYHFRRHTWIGLPDTIVYPGAEWEPARPLYEAGDYAAAAEKGLQLLEDHPDSAALYYNVACCESRAGRPGDAIEYLCGAIERWEGCREMAMGDSDFDPIRDQAGFKELVGA